MTTDISTLANWIRTSASTVFFGGAGVSTESGIPDFRGANGFYFQERTIPLEQVLVSISFRFIPRPIGSGSAKSISR